MRLFGDASALDPNPRRDSTTATQTTNLEPNMGAIP
jgi:hypothetical protein